jgi:hypothetical protein
MAWNCPSFCEMTSPRCRRSLSSISTPAPATTATFTVSPLRTRVSLTGGAMKVALGAVPAQPVSSAVETRSADSMWRMIEVLFFAARV